MCKELNFKNTKDLVRALVNANYSDYYSEEEKEEYFDQFEDDLEGLNEIEVGIGGDRYYLTPLAKKYLPYSYDRYDDIADETGDEDIPNFISYISTALEEGNNDYIEYDNAYKAWHDMLFDDYDTQEYKDSVNNVFDECMRLGLLTK